VRGVAVLIGSAMPNYTLNAEMKKKRATRKKQLKKCQALNVVLWNTA